jgi:NAD(P)-dependent dehydrogenase (short-subunit alcohol dehydrogenase family)
MKFALFTGATGGLGSACVEALAKRGGWTVFAAGMSAAALARLGELPDILPLRMDVTSQASVDEALETVRGKTDRLDAIINFAGLTGLSSLVEGESVELIEKVLAVNLVGTARVNRAFFELVRSGGGRIINCSSESGWMTPTPFAGPYVLSKYALEAYNDSLRRELIFLGIPVVKIQPGSFDTNITKEIDRYYGQALAGTKYYKELLTKMKPMMAMELSQRNDLRRLVSVLVRALESRRPRLYYRVGTGRLLALLELLPESWVDRVYLLAAGARK